MTEHDNTNSGTLFKNDTAGKSDKFPGYGGSLNVEGVEYWISGWVKEGKKGKFFSLAIKPKEGQAAQSRPTQAAPKDESFESDDPPF